MLPNSSRTTSSNRSWTRNLFYDHPIRNDGSHIYGAQSSGKVKVYCIRCFEAGISVLQRRDNDEVAAGTRQVPRTKDELDLFMWTENSDHIRSSHSSTILNHLETCTLQPEEVRAWARSVKDAKKRAPGTRGRAAFNASPLQPAGLVAPGPHPAVPPYASGSSSIVVWPAELDPHTSNRRYHPYHSPVPSITYSPSSTPDGLSPSDSISMVGSQSVSRSSSLGFIQRGPIPIPPSEPPIQVWTPERRKEFEKWMLRLTVSAGLPLSWIENPEWAKLCDDFIPGAPQISRKELAQRILPEVLNEFREEAKRKSRGKEATVIMQSDHHLLAFMIAADQKLHTVKVTDTTAERKTAENLLVKLEEVCSDLYTKWEVLVSGLVTDASGEAQKARRLFARKYPSVIVIDCYAHQVNLIVGDFFKCNSASLEYSEMATQLIAWLRSKTLVHANLPLAVVRAVSTRWTSHYIAYLRLLQLYPSLITLALRDRTITVERERTLITGDAAAQRKAMEMVAIIENPLFWHNIALITRYLEPLAIAANINRQSFFRLDQVLLTFSFLMMKYQDPKMNQDLRACQAIRNSIEARWAKADQEVFVAAVIVNPFYRMSPFRLLTCFSVAEVRALLTRLYRRLFSIEPPLQFIAHANEFLDGRDFFNLIESAIDFEIESAVVQKRQPNPVDVLNQFTFPGHSDETTSPFIKFARRLLSVSAKSASCETLFSDLGNILPKQRNQTGNSTLTNLAEAKMHMRDEHIAAGTKSRIKSRFAARKSSEESQASASGTITQHPNVDAIIDAIANVSQPILVAQGAVQAVQPMVPNIPDQSSSATTPGFSTLISQHIQQLDEDDQDNEPISVSNHWIRKKITELFDFNSTDWSSRTGRFADMIWTFEEELELYELLELDADEETEPDFDPATLEILFN